MEDPAWIQTSSVCVFPLEQEVSNPEAWTALGGDIPAPGSLH